MSCDFYKHRINVFKEQLAAYDAAILALLTGTVQSYELDTGQSKQKVTKLDLASLQKAQDFIQNEIVKLERQCAGTAVVFTGAGF